MKDVLERAIGELLEIYRSVVLLRDVVGTFHSGDFSDS